MPATDPVVKSTVKAIFSCLRYGYGEVKATGAE